MDTTFIINKATQHKWRNTKPCFTEHGRNYTKINLKENEKVMSEDLEETKPLNLFFQNTSSSLEITEVPNTATKVNIIL